MTTKLSPISRETLAHWVSCLVQIPSVTPLQAHGQPEIAGEGRLALLVAHYFRAFGGEVSLDEIWLGRDPMFMVCGLAGYCLVMGLGSIDQAYGSVEWVELGQLEKWLLFTRVGGVWFRIKPLYVA